MFLYLRFASTSRIKLTADESTLATHLAVGALLRVLQVLAGPNQAAASLARREQQPETGVWVYGGFRRAQHVDLQHGNYLDVVTGGTGSD